MPAAVGVDARVGSFVEGVERREVVGVELEPALVERDGQIGVLTGDTWLVPRPRATAAKPA